MSINIDISPGAASGVPEVLNAVIAFLALVVAVTSIYLTLRSIKTQEQHNRLSVRPIPQIILGDYENKLLVRIDNNGPGTLIINNLEVFNENETKSDIISLMPSLPPGMAWDDYVSGLQGKTIKPGSGLVLISLSGAPALSLFSAARDVCRASLANLTIRFTYTDVYGSSFAPCERALTWFARSKT